MRKHFRSTAIGLLTAALPTFLVAPAAKADPVTVQASVLYQIEETTGDVDNASTDSTVRYQLCGVLKCTAERQLDDPDRDNRERGGIDTYTREWEDVGPVKNLYIFQETDGGSWYLVRLRIKYGDRVDTFLYDNWMPRGSWVGIPVA
jgi:Tfp pilus assembly protein PilW